MIIEEQLKETDDFSKLNSQNHFEGDILLMNNVDGTQSSAVHEDRLWADAKIPYILLIIYML